jgi:DNA-binding MarR family transcriptional regulator
MQAAEPVVVKLQDWIEVFMRGSMRHFLCHARESGLSMSQLGALLHLHHAGSSGITDIGDHLGVTSAAASQMLDRLARQGLILRLEDPSDRRVKQVVLTDKGLQVIHETARARQQWLVDLAETMSGPEKEAVTAALEVLIERAKQLNQPSGADL